MRSMPKSGAGQNMEALSQEKWGTLQAKRCDLAIEGEGK